MQRLKRSVRFIRYRILLNLTYLFSLSKLIWDLVWRPFDKLTQLILASFRARKYRAKTGMNTNEFSNVGQYSRSTIFSNDRFSSLIYESFSIPPISIQRGYEITFELMLSALVMLISVIGLLVVDPSIAEELGIVILLILVSTVSIIGYGIYERKSSQYVQQSKQVVENSNIKTKERLEIQGQLYKLSYEEINRLRSFFSNPSGNYSLSEKESIGTQIGIFLRTHGVVLAQNMAASALFEVVKGILF